MNARMLTSLRWHCSLVLVLFLGCQTDQAKKSDDLQTNIARDHNPKPDEVAEIKPPEILPDTHMSAGRLHESQGHLARAIDQYQQVIALAPDYLEAYNRMGIVLDRLGRFKEADEVFNRAIKRAPREAYLRNNLAFSYIMQTRWKEAEAELTQALQDRPDFARARVNLGMVYAQQEKFDSAMAQFEIALPKEDAYYNMGLMYQSKRRPADAAVAFKNALKHNPRLVAAQKRLDAMPPDVVNAVKEDSAVTASPVAVASVGVPASEKRTAPASQPAVTAVTTRPSGTADASPKPVTTKPSQAAAIEIKPQHTAPRQASASENKPNTLTTKPSQASAAKPKAVATRPAQAAATPVKPKPAATRPGQAAALPVQPKRVASRPSQAAAMKLSKPAPAQPAPAATVDINIAPKAAAPFKAAANQPQAIPAASRPSQAATANQTVKPAPLPPAASSAKPAYRPLNDEWWETHDPLAMPLDCVEPVASAKPADINCEEEQDEDVRMHIVKVWNSMARPLNRLFGPPALTPASPYPPFGPPLPATGIRSVKPVGSKSPKK